MIKQRNLFKLLLSDDGGSDSSIDDGLPKHLEVIAAAKVEEKRMIHRFKPIRISIDRCVWKSPVRRKQQQNHRKKTTKKKKQIKKILKKFDESLTLSAKMS